MTEANICKTCRFYDEFCAKDDDQDYDLGICTIKRDRLPLCIKCDCNTFVHGDWENCPTWTAPLKEGESDVPVVKPEAAQIAPRWLPVGPVIWGNGILVDQFSAVLDFAERHAALINTDDLNMAQDHERLFLGQDCDQDAEALERLCDALNRACPPFCFFGSHPGNDSDIGVWPDDDAIDEAIRDKKLAKVKHWLDVEYLSPQWKYALVSNPPIKGIALYERAKGVQGMIWKV